MLELAGNMQVLLIRRASQPSKGLLCFPGGRLEWGETVAECAARECLEETGIALRCKSREDVEFVPAPASPVAGVEHPWPLAVVDGLFRESDGALAFHYAIIEVPSAAPSRRRTFATSKNSQGSRACY